MRRFKELARKLTYLEPTQVSQIQDAYQLAEEAHASQTRRSGEPYITHPLAVACDLADMRMDADTIMAALLHDVIEDTPVTKTEISSRFGEIVAELVDGVSKLTQIEFKSRVEAQAENFRKMLLAMAKDIRVIIVKLADRLHNMRTIGAMPIDKKRRIARETLDIFAPIAHRLGMHEVAIELQNLGFQALYPGRYQILQATVQRVRGDQKKILSTIKKSIEKKLSEAKITNYSVIGREKHLYSIYKKMLKKHLSFKEVMDVYGFRIITDSEDNCYRILGLVHSVYKPISERFKDYIAIPKANGYQSLHTTLFGPEGIPVEIQIRTSEMEHVASSGIASHWRYKWDEKAPSHAQATADSWLKNLMEMQQKTGSSLEFFEDVKIDLFPDEIYVFTPRGKIVKLPARSTPVDFAYMVHTDIGNSCVAAKIDRQLAPLSTHLTNGQTVEVITSKEARPNLNWLDFVVTAKAKSAVRHYLKNQKRGEAVLLGRRMLEQAMHDYALNLRKFSQQDLAKISHDFQYHELDDLLADIGLGNRSALVVAHQFSQQKKTHLSEAEKENLDKTPLMILGTEGMVVRFATCCYPLPGDSILGLVEQGKGIEIHLIACENAEKKAQNARLIDVSWAKNVQGSFMVIIEIEALNQTGALAGVAKIVADHGADIEDVTMTQPDQTYFTAQLKLKVRDRMHLADIMRGLKQFNIVNKVVRKKAGKK